jgi:hypothetical protein
MRQAVASQLQRVWLHMTEFLVVRIAYEPLGCMVDTCNAFSNNLPLKLGVEDVAFCTNLQWNQPPYTQEKTHMQIMS